MKTLLKTIIIFGLILNMNAQSSEINSQKMNVKNIAKSIIKLDQKLMIKKGLYMGLSPQFGNLFITQLEAKKAKINLKDYYNDFDFGFNFQISYDLIKNLNFAVLYNVGMLRFNSSNTSSVLGPVMKLRIHYWL